MATSLELRSRMKSMRDSANKMAHGFERKAVSGVAGAAIGFLEQRGTLPVAVAGVPTKLALGIGLSLLEANSKGAARRVAGAAADVSLGIYAYQAAKTKNLVAGMVDED